MCTQVLRRCLAVRVGCPGLYLLFFLPLPCATARVSPLLTPSQYALLPDGLFIFRLPSSARSLIPISDSVDLPDGATKFSLPCEYLTERFAITMLSTSC